MANLVIEKCNVEDNFLNFNTLLFTGKAIILSHCYNVKALHATVFRGLQTHILAINILGNSSL